MRKWTGERRDREMSRSLFGATRKFLTRKVLFTFLAKKVLLSRLFEQHQFSIQAVLESYAVGDLIVIKLFMS